MPEILRDYLSEVALDTLIDTVKLLPFLFVTYLLMEWLESKFSDRADEYIRKSGRFGPLIGTLLGVVPQCGFSAAASSLYAGRVITAGTLVAVFLSTSDEMIPVMASEVAVKPMLVTIAFKLAIALIAGFAIDLVLRKKNKNRHVGISELCEKEHCECAGGGIWRPAIKHTISVIIFVFAFLLVLNSLIFFIGEDNVKGFMAKNEILSVVISAFIGLVPSCASSVLITQSYLTGIVPYGAMLAGLLSGSGVGILVLFRTNRKIKENLLITAAILAVGILSGVICVLCGLKI